VSEQELFVVCPNCSSEVSPYVTECPYCGQRVRKRAPKISRGSDPDEPPPRRRRPRAPTLGRLRRDEIPGIAPETRPYATRLLIVAAPVANILVATNHVQLIGNGGLLFKPDHEWWRVATTPFLYPGNPGYEFVALLGVALFGTLLERRFGLLAPIAIFMLAGAGGAFLGAELNDFPILGANGAALGLLAAWFVDDRLANRRGDDRGNDLIGVWVFAAVLLLLPLADDTASFYAGIGGAAVGAAVGAVMSPLRP